MCLFSAAFQAPCTDIQAVLTCWDMLRGTASVLQLEDYVSHVWS